jgi:hypothetical protein
VLLQRSRFVRHVRHTEDRWLAGSEPHPFPFKAAETTRRMGGAAWPRDS